MAHPGSDAFIDEDAEALRLIVQGPQLIRAQSENLSLVLIGPE